MSADVAIAQILADTNAIRAQAGKPALVRNAAMDAVAASWSRQMFANGSLSHNPSYTAQIPQGWTRAAENVAYGQRHSDVVAAWAASSGHYANMVGDYTDIGIGYYEQDGKRYFTQNFGKYSTAAATASTPFGWLDSVTVSGVGTATAAGWAIDPDTAAAVSVVLTVDGAPAATVTANTVKQGLGAVFPIFGDNHGYSATLTIPPGTHTVCATAANVGAGSNALLPVCRSVVIASGSPFGWLDSVTVSGVGTATAAGWAIDPDTAAAVSVVLTVDGAPAATVTANTVKQGLGAVFPIFGDNHGYSATLTIPPGTHTVCATAANVGAGSNALLPVCRSVVIASGSPFGWLDSVTVSGVGTATAAGWAIDPDTAAAVSVVLTVDGAPAATVTANTVKQGLGAVFPIFGDNHGYSATLTIPPGTHTVCATAANVGAGSNALLPVCRSVVIASGSPFGWLDSVTVSGVGTATAAGWAIDPDTAAAVSVVLTVDGAPAATVTANTVKQGLGAVFPIFGDNHGYSATLTIPPGTHTVCATAANVGAGSNALLPVCRSVVIASGSPFGWLDSVTVSGVGTATAAGWAIDPDTAAAVSVVLTVDGAPAATVTANTVKQGLGAVFPIFGDNHGYSATLTIPPGTHTVCATAANVGAGSNALLPVCRSVVIASGSPFGWLDSVTVSGVGTATAAGWAIDPDTAAAVSVVLTVDGAPAATVTANTVKQGLGAVFPIFGDNHGYSATLTIPPGTHTVCATAANVGAGSNALLPVCRSVVIASVPASAEALG